MSPRHHFSDRKIHQNRQRYHSPMFYETPEYKLENQIETFFINLLKKITFWKKS